MAFKRLAPCTCGTKPHQADCERRRQQEETDRRIEEILGMATLDDLFGKPAGEQRWMKFENEGEAFLLEQTAEPKLVPQKGPNGRNIWLVQVNEGDKYQPKEEGSFDPDSVHRSFMPDKDIVIPAKVLAKKLKDGAADPTHEPFDTEWELTKDQREKFREAMLDSGQSAEAGTKYAVKLLSRAKKPYSYSVKILDKKD